MQFSYHIYVIICICNIKLTNKAYQIIQTKATLYNNLSLNSKTHINYYQPPNHYTTHTNKNMAIPQSLGDFNNIHYYQGIIIAEVAVTFGLYVLLRIIHYLRWGANDQMDMQKAPTRQIGSSGALQEDSFLKKWDQKVWDVYFPIIYTTHMAALSLTLLYIPYIFETIMAYIHLAVFICLLLANIFIHDAQIGNGNRTTASRILWALMCLINLSLIIAGLTGIPKVL